ncbi:transcription factor FapR [Laceyella sacchari]|jgi:acyl-coenzyme A thioesterase PaaI-like protein|uniref:Acyl-coenzyme A thioesterase PaaI, contains HGG motif n=3 Tax=Laceyella TaxID=292635 RepID=A0AA45WLA6_9BACL|nr:MULTISPECIES: transcription factor FapR [Laceyella]KPC74906.1 fatty acid biosynthesis transcriptional regulator [Thermoactinomyces vulgaris]AUS09273.1 transcription factor FapR [Laceyella sacchari]MRG29070.1 transcription factor FapR [Laceyella tengchongensis]PRZ13657.1 acyl-coenzyme A thioesterase PaaI-like protein [Laceyella sediminis]TCW37472.1 acyl-coenzyme A thioesterase PaaI-like protein [Laceyella sacchari]
MRIPKKERQRIIAQSFQEEPFLTDEEMAKRCNVSIQTIRLDRVELGIPELRERIKHMAENHFDPVKSLLQEEVIGEIVDLQLDQSGVSILEINKEHVFARNQIARGHILFAQANSLAVAIVDAEVALTGSAGIRFVRPVRLGEKCIAHAKVIRKQINNSLQVDVKTKVNGEIVFQGIFDVYRLEDGRVSM